MDNDLDLTVEIVSAYVYRNPLRHDLVPEFMDLIFNKVSELRAKAPTPQNSADSANLTDTKELLQEDGVEEMVEVPPMVEEIGPETKGTSFFHGVYVEDDKC